MPEVIVPGVAQVRVGVALFTTRETVPVAGLMFVVSVGVNLTLNVCVPAFRVAPLAGLYANGPATLPVALSCVAESAVP